MKSEEKQAAKQHLSSASGASIMDKVKDLTRPTTHHVTKENDGSSNKT